MHSATDKEVERLRAMETHFDRIIAAVDANPPGNGDVVGGHAIAAVEAYRAQGEGKWARAIVSTLDVVFDGPAGPLSGRFVEVERLDGTSINVGDWIEKPNGWSALRLRVVTP